MKSQYSFFFHILNLSTVVNKHLGDTFTGCLTNSSNLLLGLSVLHSNLRDVKMNLAYYLITFSLSSLLCKYVIVELYFNIFAFNCFGYTLFIWFNIFTSPSFPAF